MPKADWAIAPDYITEMVQEYKARYNIGSISSLARHFKVGMGVMQKGVNAGIWSRKTEIHILKLIKKLGE